MNSILFSNYIMNFKYLSILILIIFFGCEKKFDATVETTFDSYQILKLSYLSGFTYNPTDSSFVISITFDNSKSVSSVYVEVYSPQNKKVNSVPLILNDDGNNGDLLKGDNIYSSKFSLSQSNSNGFYKIEYFITEKSGSIKKAASQSFLYNNGQSNVSPRISNLSAPDSAEIGSSPTLILITVAAQDSNGLSDIDKVFFNSFVPPNGEPASGNPFYMYDDGSHGDKIVGDGIFSITIVLPTSGVTKGVYRWEFQAVDRSRLESNLIIHNIKIK